MKSIVIRQVIEVVLWKVYCITIHYQTGEFPGKMVDFPRKETQVMRRPEGERDQELAEYGPGTKSSSRPIYAKFY
jgi:hypothetical protein